MPHKNYRRNDPEIARFRNNRVIQPRSTEYDHVLEHMFFLEERITALERNVQQLKDIFEFLLEIDEEGEKDE